MIICCIFNLHNRRSCTEFRADIFSDTAICPLLLSSPHTLLLFGLVLFLVSPGKTLLKSFLGGAWWEGYTWMFLLSLDAQTSTSLHSFWCSMSNFLNLLTASHGCCWFSFPVSCTGGLRACSGLTPLSSQCKVGMIWTIHGALCP